MQNLKELFHHWFVPSHKNNHHARSVSHGALFMFAFLSVFSFIVLKNIAIQTGNVLGFATNINIDNLYSKTNEVRQQNGLQALSLNSKLSQAAQAKAQDMFAKNYWAHFGPSGETPWQFIVGADYKYDYAGENLAKNFDSSVDVVQAWMDSLTHRENILNTNYTDVGFAIANGTLNGEETTLVVQMFANPEKPIAKVQNNSNDLQPVVAKNTNSAPAVKAKVNKLPQEEPGITYAPTVTPKTFSQTSIPTQTSDLHNALPLLNQTHATPSINLYPAFKSLVAMLVAFLVAAFVVDLYFLSHVGQTAHRGKHIAHIIFLVAILIAMFFLGRGSIM